MYLHKSIMNQFFLSYYGSPYFSNSYGTPSFYFWISCLMMQLPNLKYRAPWFGIWRSIINYGDPYIDCGYTYICLTIHGSSLLNIILDLINYLQWLYNEWDGADQRKHGSSASLVFVRGIHCDWWIPLTKASNAAMIPFDDVIMHRVLSAITLPCYFLKCCSCQHVIVRLNSLAHGRFH